MDLPLLLQKIEDFWNTCNERKQKPLFVLLGPTASGKTALSLKIAKHFGAEIISADSRQVYRRMDIGTDKIMPDQREGIPHYLIDVVNPEERFTVVDFMKLADEAIEKILAKGKLPMLVGGTGLYITALTENFQIPATGDNLELRKKLQKDLEQNGKQWLHEQLKRVDPEGAKKNHPNNHFYVMRALEIYHLTGKPKRDVKGAPKYATLKIGLSSPREELFKRIEQRALAQFDRGLEVAPPWRGINVLTEPRLGLIEETKKLLAMGCDKNMQSMRTLGYSETVQFLEGGISLEDAKKLLVKNTRDFAKRQLTWFKKDKTIEWIEA